MSNPLTAMLDELMGRNRNANSAAERQRETKWSDPEVCPYFLAGYCPHEMFTNTKADLGPCDKIHDERLKEQYVKSSRFGKVGLEEEFLAYLQRVQADMQRKIDRNKSRLELTQPGGEVKDADKEQILDKIRQLSEKISALLSQAEQLGEKGEVEEAQKVVRMMEELKDERDRLQQNVEAPTTELRSMEVCDICGCFLVYNDAPHRLDEHFTGKQHIGFAKIKVTVEELLKKRQEKREQFEKEMKEIREKEEKARKRSRSRSRKRSRSKKRSKSRDRSRRSTSRSGRKSSMSSSKRDKRHRSRSRTKSPKDKERSSSTNKKKEGAVKISNDEKSRRRSDAKSSSSTSKHDDRRHRRSRSRDRDHRKSHSHRRDNGESSSSRKPSKHDEKPENRSANIKKEEKQKNDAKVEEIRNDSNSDNVVEAQNGQKPTKTIEGHADTTEANSTFVIHAQHEQVNGCDDDNREVASTTQPDNTAEEVKSD